MAARVQHWLAMLLRTGRLPALLAALGTLALLYGFLFSSDFLIASVEVRGTQLGDSAEVAQAADALGESIFRIDSGHVALRVAALPYVERVTVETRFPDHVVLTVTERVPVLVWQTETQQLLVDERANVIGPTQSSSLPTVIGSDSQVTDGSLDARTVAAAVALQQSLGTRLDRLEMTSLDGFTAILGDGRTIVFGDSTEIPSKLAIFAEVERQGVNWSLLDLREPGRPYYK